MNLHKKSPLFKSGDFCAVETPAQCAGFRKGYADEQFVAVSPVPPLFPFSPCGRRVGMRGKPGKTYKR